MNNILSAGLAALVMGLDTTHGPDFNGYLVKPDKAPKDKKTLKRRAKNKAARKARKK